MFFILGILTLNSSDNNTANCKTKEFDPESKGVDFSMLLESRKSGHSKVKNLYNFGYWMCS